MKVFFQLLLILADVFLIIGSPAGYEQGKIGLVPAVILTMIGIAIAAGMVFLHK